jgi:hypothetical protein
VSQEPSGNRNEEPSGNRAALDTCEIDFDQCWSLYPRKDSRKLALKAWGARLKEGVNAMDLLTATEHYAKVKAGEEERFVMLGSTFFGPNERWVDFLDPACIARAKPQPKKSKSRQKTDRLMELKRERDQRRNGQKELTE